MKILHIEDCPEISTVFSDVLAIKNHHFESTTDGQKGLEMVLKNNYDLILLDLGLPFYSGFQFLTDLKINKPSQIKKVVIVTSLPLEEFKIQFLMNHGIHSIHNKPISVHDLISKITPPHVS